MNRQTPIMDALSVVCGNARVRLCMPGHKGDTGFFGGELLWCDITELPGADNLLKPEGAILQSEALHADYIGAEAVAYTTGGSTAGITAMLSLFRGKKVIFPRGVHLSAANAVITHGIIPVYLEAAPSDFPAVVRPQDVRDALKTHRDAAAVFLVYPNYFGLCANIEEIADIVHKAGIPLLVDVAHGAHFAFSPMLPKSPGAAGADIWVESTHKMLPAMNQCACLCVGRGSRVSKDDAIRAMSCFQSTSPSYILLGSMDYAHAYMRDKGEQELFRVISLARRFEELLGLVSGISCPDIRMPDMADKDPLKLVIDVSGTGYTGLQVKSTLAQQGIHVEAADMRNILLMLSPGTTSEHLDSLYGALRTMGRIQRNHMYFSPYSMPKATKYSQNSRFWGNIEKVRIERAAGLISASTAGVYPPAEVVVARGQQITYEVSVYLLEAKRQGFEVFGIDGDSIWVFKERT